MTPDRPELKSDVTVARLTGDWQEAATVTPGLRSEAFVLDPHAVPGYELLGEIGRGGMGVVYRARHLGLNREVALKMVLTGAHASPTDRARFRAEAETVARLQHPNVVQVYDVGEAAGLPYLSLEICQGSLADQLDGTPWPAERAVALIATLARAAHAAHTAGVIHRDLKPGNVLLTADGTPKLTDFGLAKRVGDSGGPTATGAVLGTPSYMAPEQASGTIQAGPRGPRIYGPPTDVYALGAILYELLTGRPPFKASSPLDTLIMVSREEPIPPVRLAPKVPRDLQTICLKCLEKEPNRRYATAAELAGDLERFSRNEPIVARPVPAWERALKWARRRPTAAALVAVSVAALFTVAALGWYFSGQLRDERDAAMLAEKEAAANFRRAEAEALKARRNNYVLAMGQVQLAWQQSAMTRLRTLLAEQIPRNGEEDLRGFEWHYWNRAARGAPTALEPPSDQRSIRCMAISADGRWLATAPQSGPAAIWDLSTGTLARTISGNGRALSCVAFGKSANVLVLGGESGVFIANFTTGQIVRKLPFEGGATALAVRLTDGALAVQRIREFGIARMDLWSHVDLWNIDTGEKLRTLPGQTQVEGPIAFSPDGRWLAVGGLTVSIWDVESGERRSKLPPGWVGGFSPDGRRLAVIDRSRTASGREVHVVDVNTGRIALNLMGHSETVHRVVYSPDGRFLATAGDDHTVRLWDAANGQERNRFRGRSKRNIDVAFRPGAATLAAATYGGAIELWPFDFDAETVTTKAHELMGAQSLALHADSGRVAGAGFMNGAIDELATHKTVARLGFTASTASRAAFSPDGRYFATGFNAGQVRIWRLDNGRQVGAFQTALAPVRALAFSADGRVLAVAAQLERTRRRVGPTASHVLVWDVERGERRQLIQVEPGDSIDALALSADGTRLLTGSSRLVFRVWDAVTGQPLATLLDRSNAGETGAIVALNPDGTVAALGQTNSDSTSDPTIELIEVESGARLHSLGGHSRGLRAMSFSADGRRLASASDDDTMRVWDVATGQEVLSRPSPHVVVDLGFTHDGKKLIAVGQDGTTRIWQADD